MLRNGILVNCNVNLKRAVFFLIVFLQQFYLFFIQFVLLSESNSHGDDYQSAMNSLNDVIRQYSESESSPPTSEFMDLTLSEAPTFSSGYILNVFISFQVVITEK